MRPRWTAMRGWLQDKRGATSIEYALIALLLSIVIVAGATVIGTQLNIMLTRTSAGLSSNP